MLLRVHLGCQVLIVSVVPQPEVGWQMGRPTTSVKLTSTVVSSIGQRLLFWQTIRHQLKLFQRNDYHQRQVFACLLICIMH